MCQGTFKDCWKFANRVGLFFVALFVLCFFWHLWRPVDAELRVKLFQMAFLWFKGFDWMSFVLAVVQSYVYGYIVLGVWHLVNGGRCQFCCAPKHEHHTV